MGINFRGILAKLNPREIYHLHGTQDWGWVTIYQWLLDHWLCKLQYTHFKNGYTGLFARAPANNFHTCEQNLLEQIVASQQTTFTGLKIALWRIGNSWLLTAGPSNGHLAIVMQAKWSYTAARHHSSLKDNWQQNRIYNSIVLLATASELNVGDNWLRENVFHYKWPTVHKSRLLACVIIYNNYYIYTVEPPLMDPSRSRTTSLQWTGSLVRI